MDLSRASIVLRPRGVLEVVDLSFRFVLDLRPEVFARLSLVVVVLPTAVLVRLWSQGIVDALSAWVAAIAFGTVAQGVLTVAAGELMFAPETTTRQVWRHFARRLGPYLAVLLYSRLLLLASLGVLAGRALFVHEACLLEQAGIRAAWGRSSSVGRSDGGEVISALFAMVGLQLSVVCVFELLGHAVFETLLVLPNVGGTLTRDGISAFALAGYFASLPLVSTLRFLSYINSRTRRDGWDIQVRFMALAGKR